jgi:hypothetical protein
MDKQQYYCLVCSEVGNFEDVSSHVISKHLAAKECPFICKIDGERFTKRNSAVKHFRISHPAILKKGQFKDHTSGTRQSWDSVQSKKYIGLDNPTMVKSRPDVKTSTSETATAAIEEPKPRTPVKEWENVPRPNKRCIDHVDDLADDMFAVLQLSPEKRSRVTPGEPTYLPFDHSRDLLGAVVDLQHTCEELSHRLYHSQESLTEGLLQIKDEVARDRHHQSDVMSDLIAETRKLREIRERSNALVEKQLGQLDKLVELETRKAVFYEKYDKKQSTLSK